MLQGEREQQRKTKGGKEVYGKGKKGVEQLDSQGGGNLEKINDTRLRN